MNACSTWWLLIPGLPISADGPTFDEALDDVISAVREYAEYRVSNLRTAPLVGGRETLPAEIVYMLAAKAGLSEDEIARMSRDEAIARTSHF